MSICVVWNYKTLTLVEITCSCTYMNVLIDNMNEISIDHVVISYDQEWHLREVDTKHVTEQMLQKMLENVCEICVSNWVLQHVEVDHFIISKLFWNGVKMRKYCHVVDRIFNHHCHFNKVGKPQLKLNLSSHSFSTHSSAFCLCWNS